MFLLMSLPLRRAGAAEKGTRTHGRQKAAAEDWCERSPFPAGGKDVTVRQRGLAFSDSARQRKWQTGRPRRAKLKIGSLARHLRRRAHARPSLIVYRPLAGKNSGPSRSSSDFPKEKPSGGEVEK